MIKNGMRPVHPGEILREDYLGPIGMTANALATALHVTPARINDIVWERRGITADAQSWLNLQTIYDLRQAEMKTGDRIAQTIALRAA